MESAKKTDQAFLAAVAWVAERLSRQEMFAFEQIIARPWERHLLAEHMSRSWPEISKSSLGKAVSKARLTLKQYFLSSEGISLENRYSLAEGRLWKIEKKQNLIPSTTQFWLGHLQNGRRTRIVLGEPASSQRRTLGSGPFETTLSSRPKATRARPVARDSSPLLSADEEVIEDEEPTIAPPPSTPIGALMSGDPFRRVRLGDVRAAFAIHSYFKDRHDEGIGYPEPELISLSDTDQDETDNLVILGATATDRAFIATTWNPHFNVVLVDGNMLFETYASGKRSAKGWAKYPTSCFVLVSRTVGQSGNCITLITGGHPSAVQEICRLLINKVRVEEELVAPLALNPEKWHSAAHFQIVFEVHLTSDERSVESIKADRFVTLEKRNIEPESVLKSFG
jgi:hypothetical protein